MLEDYPCGSKLPIDLENRIVALAQGGDIAARNALIEHHYPFIRTTVARGLFPSDDVEAFVSHGVEAFIRSIRGFDASRGLRLVTYAHYAIVRAVRDARHADRVVKPPLNRNRRRWSERVGRDEARTSLPRSLDYADADGRRTLVAEARAEADTGETAEWLRWSMGWLDDREREVIDLRYRGMTLEEVGKHLGITKERVRQIQWRAMERLREIAA